jgi:hypothetical protein
MKLHQLSVFLENKPGQLNMACKLLAQEKINIITLSLADTQQFGILRLIVKDWEKAQQVLQKNGITTKISEVIAIEVADHPGGLADILIAIESAGLNVDYMYAFAFGHEDKAILIFRFENPDLAVKQLQAKGVNVISNVDLYSRVKP